MQHEAMVGLECQSCPPAGPTTDKPRMASDLPYQLDSYRSYECPLGFQTLLGLEFPSNRLDDYAASGGRHCATVRHRG